MRVAVAAWAWTSVIAAWPISQPYGRRRLHPPRLHEGGGPFPALVQWVVGSGGEVDEALGVGDVDGMRGVVVNREIAPLRTEMIRVPSALGLSEDADDLLDSPLGIALGRTGLALLQPDARLALRLLLEDSLGEDSPWSDYIALLPVHVPCARHLDDDFLLECRSDFVLKQAMLARKYAATTYASLGRQLGGAAVPFTEERFGWALDVVHSRSFSVDMGVRGLRRIMVPYIDFLNCSPGRGCTFTFDPTDEPPSFVVELPAGEARPAPGEQLFLDYGRQTSEELALMYGFVPREPTSHDVIELTGAFSPEDLASAPGDNAMREEKEALLQSCRYAPPRTFELQARQIDPAIVCALRLTLLTPEELNESCSSNWNRPLAHKPVSRANERRVAIALCGRLRTMLAADATTLEEDRRLISSWDGTEDGTEAAGEAVDGEEQRGTGLPLRDAVQMRANRKQLVAESIEQLESFVQQLESPLGEDASDAKGEARAGGERCENLLDFMDDYLPTMRML